MSNFPHYSFVVSHLEDGWITPFAEAVASIEFEVARWKPAADAPSVAELTHHALNYLENLGRRLKGQPVVDHEDWPETRLDEPGDWRALQGRVKVATAAVKQSLESMPGADLATEVDGQALSERVIDISIHGAYHAGQVVKLAQLHEALGAMEAAAVL